MDDADDVVAPPAFVHHPDEDAAIERIRRMRPGYLATKRLWEQVQAQLRTPPVKWDPPLDG